MPDLMAHQRASNAETRDGWDRFADHRAMVTKLLADGADPGRSRLCVLGAGSCNDLDLAALLGAHREVHLVDLDAEALALGVGRQGVAGATGLRVHGGVDVTGMLVAIATWSPSTVLGPEELARRVDMPACLLGPSLPGPFDVVASTCLLSQLIGGVVSAVGEAHARFPELVRATREGHLRLLSRLTATGGAAVLIADIVSSETVPGLGSVPQPALSRLLGQVARDRNFFHGANPAALRSAVATIPGLDAELEGPEMVHPWRWDLGPRLYLVWALRWRKRGEIEGDVEAPGPLAGRDPSIMESH